MMARRCRGDSDDMATGRYGVVGTVGAGAGVAVVGVVTTGVDGVTAGVTVGADVVGATTTGGAVLATTAPVAPIPTVPGFTPATAHAATAPA